MSTNSSTKSGPYPQVHASTLVETTSGQLIAAWFGGTEEGDPDVSIWVARLENGARWSPGVKVADGVQDATKRHPTWNPVLFQPRGGPLMLFYKVGPSPREWWGMVITSSDDGRTWSDPRRLPEGILGPIKNKPVQLADGTIVAGSSTEAVDTDAWRVHVERSTRSRTDVGTRRPVGDGGFNAIQPDILRHADGRLQLLCRSKEMEVPTSWSSDGGRTWSALAKSGLYAVNSGSDAVTLQDGRHVLVYNYSRPPGRIAGELSARHAHRHHKTRRPGRAHAGRWSCRCHATASPGSRRSRWRTRRSATATPIRR